MNFDVSKTEESNGRGSSWPPIPLLPEVWVCLGFVCIWLVWNIYNAYHIDNLIHARQLRAETLRGVVVHLDEALMAARMAAVTGDQRWEERYQHVATIWADALHKAQELGPMVSHVDLMSVAAAAKRIGGIERQAFALVQQGHAEAAHDVLSGQEYEAQRRLVVQGIQEFLNEISTQFNTMYRAQHIKLIWSFIATMVTLATSLGIGQALASRRHHRRLLSSITRSEHEPPEVALPKNEAHYWELFENASDFVYTCDMHGYLTSANKAGARLLGYARDELPGICLADLMPPDSLAHSRQKRITKEAGTAWTTYEVEVSTKDNLRVPLEVSTRFIYRDGAAIGVQGIGRDVTERKQAEAVLQKAHDELEMRVAQRTAELQHINEQLHLEIAERRQAEEHYWELFENASDLVYTVDMQGHLTSLNKAGERMLGYSRDEVVGRELAVIVSTESLKRSRQMRESKETGTDWTTYEVEVITKDKRRVPLEVSTRLICRNGKPFGIQGIGRDVTERKQAEEALKHARDELEMRVAQRTAELQRINEQLHLEITERLQVEAALRIAKDAAEVANRAKSEFLATITHELRTPMNGICGMTGLLLDTALDDEQREYAETVQKCSDDLLTLINDMLNFSQIETSKCALNIVEFELRIVVEDVIESLAEAAHKKDLAMTTSIQSDVPHCVAGDPGRLRQVLLILVGNAVKFTETGEVVVSIMRVEANATETVVHFAITDTGIGIPAEAHGKLFQVFSQVDGSSTRKYGGTGLGLAIAKRLVTMMDGDIGVESTLGQGSTFWFTIRFSVCATTSDTAPARPVYGRPRRQPRERLGR
jgi:PAS domain S-box-containing protein